jgi:transcriptional regulator of acetoin/glycerol metabolism
MPDPEQDPPDRDVGGFFFYCAESAPNAPDRRVERDGLLVALEASWWNVSQAARMFGITRDRLR